MNGILNVVVKIIAFADQSINNNPRLKFFDWTRDISGIAVEDPKSEAYTVPAGSSQVIFDGTRTTTLDGTSAFTTALLSTDPSRYRFTWVSGTNPTLRTGRGLTPSGIALTFTVNANSTMNLAAASSLFSGVVAGDFIFIPHTTTGDSANVISVLNAGYWKVLSYVDTQNLVLVRPDGEDFEGASEVVTPVSNSQLRAFSSAGVQVGDSVDITAGFSTATRRTFEVVAVTDAFFEVFSSSPVPAESAITPGATGMVFYSETKNFLYVESDQPIVVRANGDTGNTQRVDPVEAGDALRPGGYMKRGPCWSLTIVNRSTSDADITIIHSK